MDDFDKKSEEEKKDNFDFDLGSEKSEEDKQSQMRKTKGFQQEMEEYDEVNLNELIDDKKEEKVEKEGEKEKSKGIEELLKEEEGKQKKLLFLFDEFDEEEGDPWISK